MFVINFRYFFDAFIEMSSLCLQGERHKYAYNMHMATQ